MGGDFIIFDSFDAAFTQFSTVYNKVSGKVIGNGRFLKESKNYHLLFPFFLTVDAPANRYISVLEGYILRHYVNEASPFYQFLTNEDDLEAQYLVEMILDSLKQ
ncbi:hypothetical protein ACFOUP_15570 [Belliella kenyensis]|uniref:Uncharacterized protein n=1 Tax=Belliella kenyensis TaxID=1472724 RepID=A0ABV8ENN1_9BACT|nr:hypothetical protein [Belliella kenyensis]MCH7402023.1 hypothetical protein [Belliella kenyensis]MDN3605187.1 hypothetical protein [Belliella kenyensis]